MRDRRLARAKQYFVAHFIAQPPSARPTVADNCFGHLMKMWEAMVLADPDYLRRKYKAHGNNDVTLVAYVKFQLDVLVAMNRIKENMVAPLMANLYAYLQRANEINWIDVDPQIDFSEKLVKLVEFYKKFKHDLRAWSEFGAQCGEGSQRTAQCRQGSLVFLSYNLRWYPI